MTRLHILNENSGRTPQDIVPLAELERLIQGILENAGEQAAVDAVDATLRHAAHYGASDVHFEPWRDCLAIRFRIDGLLHDIAQLPKAHHAKLAARIKILARIVVYQRETPQDGRIEPEATPAGRAMRVATLPTVNGEKLIVRLLRTPRDVLALDALGFQPGVIDGLRAFCERPQGVLLLTGPSSSGKTTTIYATLDELLKRRQPTPHVVTLEDPVECRLDRIAQTQVAPAAGFTFEAGLRAILRQDPEVIVVGEIRDPETARAAIQAGLTGHLVISTIHSGTAAGVFARLLDMGVEPYLLASSVTAVLAQRLVRMNCPECTEAYEPGPALQAAFGLTDTGTPVKHGKGCPACQGIGYAGRTAIGEWLRVDDAFAQLVLTRPRTAELHEAALRAGMESLGTSARGLIRQGITSLEEVNRVLPAECSI